MLSSAAEMTVGAAGVPFRMERLSFMNGDWNQDAGQAPLLPPFQGPAADSSRHQPLEPVNLASFTVTHVDAVPWRSGARPKALNVSGFLTLAITRNCCSPSMEPRVGPELVLEPGVAKLRVQLEGVYTEPKPSGLVSHGGGGDRVLCMVGKALLPVRGGNGSADPWGKNHGVNSEAAPRVVADNNILLVLRYPVTRALATRAVRGEMVSLLTAESGGGAYFDRVRLVSRLHRYYSSYQFRPEEDEEELEDATARCGTGDATRSLFRGSGDAFCDVLRQFTPDNYGVMDVVQSRNNNSTTDDDELCNPLGLFETKRPATRSTRSAVAVQGLECEPDGKASARVTAVFRLVPPWEHQPTAAKRTGLGGETLSAEGAWTASTGLLCMLACRGGGEKKKKMDACRHRVTIWNYWQQQQFGRAGEKMRVEYKYTKIKQPTELLHRRRSGFRDTFIAKSLLSYPKVAGAADEMASLSNLGEDLGLRFRISPKLPFVPDWIEEPFSQLQILSIGPLVGAYQPGEQYGSMPFRSGQFNTRYSVEKQSVLEEVVEKQGDEVLMNVSAEFTAPSGNFFDSKSVLSLEGVYNPGDGRMHLIGCRDIVHAPSTTSREDLEDGMDCSVEVTVEYPPTTTRWLISPVAKVYIISTRNANDPLHFNRTEFRSLPIIYHDQRNEMTEPMVEGFLCIAVLSAAVAATVSQLRYIRSHADVAPYVSLAALGVQALGYAATLVVDARTLPAWPTANRYRSFYDAERLLWSVDCAVKALALAALLLTARLAQKVRRARAQARARSPLDPWRVPSDGAVALYSLVVYMAGLFFVLSVHGLNTPPGVPDVVVYQQAQGNNSPRMRTPISVFVGWYLGVAKEWFLLPQVVGNAIWRVNCKPLAARYYSGVTAAWLLPHVYGYLRPPVVNPDEALQHFYSSKAIAVGVPIVGVVLAFAVYVQQRWNYRIVGWMMKTGGQNKMQHVC
ncbi:hypothetical protein QOZ80_2BG0161340 [Eleusine coracana subsp. coracana]|nr:hypothetical protein QOZ80_2BG0161340 [Eleusine coracana subsp. coracana]